MANTKSWSTAMAVAFTMLAGSGCAGRQAEPEVAVDPEPTTGREVTVEEGLAVQQRAGVGAYLTDADGRAVYLLEEDPTGESICYDECAEVWPPVLVDARPDAMGASVRSGLIGTIERRDGTIQATYGGHPLYYYVEDQGPGTITGQDVHDEWGGWYLVSPAGDAVHTEAGSS